MIIETRGIKVSILLFAAIPIFIAVFCASFPVSANKLFETNPPTNPPSCIEDHAVINNTWQNSINDPSFTWIAGSDTESGVDGYFVYWGTDPNGVSVSYQQITTTYDPIAVTTGIYYLRVNTRDVDGNLAGWVTLFIFRYDNTPPSMNVTESGGASNGTWQNTITSPTFAIIPDDFGVGFDGYYLYWGADPNGTSLNPIIQGLFSFSPGFQSDGEYYLRINALDLLYNASGWQTIFIFKKDTIDPNPVTSASEINGLLPSQWNNNPTPTFNWNYPAGATKFNLYWGADPLAVVATATGIIPVYSVTAVAGTNNYLKIQSLDDAGNTSAWSTVLFTDWFDNTPPSVVTSVTETANGIISGQCTILRDATFTWNASTGTGAPLAGYYYYWGLNPIGTNTMDKIPAPPLGLNLPKGEKFYLRMAAYDDAGNVSEWTTNFILCNGDVVRLITAVGGGNLSKGVPNPIVDAAFTFSPNSFQVFEDPNWVGKDFWVRLWYPTINGHRDSPPGKVTPYTHQSFNLAADLASDTSDLYQLTLPFTITLSYSENSILALYEDSLTIYRWNGNQWKALPNSTVDTVNNTVTGATTNLGEFILLGNPIPVELQLSIIANALSFGEFPLTGRSSIISGYTDPWIILDSIYSELGWYVTISGTDFKDTQNHVIPIENLSIQIPDGNINVLVGYSPPLSLVTVPASLQTTSMTIISSQIGSNSGKFSVAPIFNLQIPADVYGGTYSSQITITIMNDIIDP